jgi:hypothetical protein
MRSALGWMGLIGASLACGAPPASTLPASLHPDIQLEEVKLPALYKTMGLDFLADGRMVLGVIEEVGMGEVPSKDSSGNKVLIVSLPKAPGDSLKVKEISNTWSQISGLLVVDGKIYVSDRDGFYRVNDIDAPANLKDNRTLILKWPDENKWRFGFSWHQWVFDPLYWHEHFYAPYSGSIIPGGYSYAVPTSSLSGAFLTWDLHDLKLEAVAGGLRSPNGANLDSSTGEMFVTDNQGCYLPASSFMRIRPGHFYGHRQIPEYRNDSGVVTQKFPPNFAESLPYDPPVAWLPYRTVRSSPSQPIVIRKGHFKGDWLIGDVNSPGLVRVYLDRVDSLINGAVFDFTQGMEKAAINRMAYGPDGSIYIGTIMRVAGNWPAMDKAPLYRLSFKASPDGFDMRAIRSVSDGLEIEFTGSADAHTFVKDSLSVVQWQYIRKPEYGYGKQDDEPLAVEKTEMSADGLRLHLVIPGLKTDRVVNLKVRALKSLTGKTLWSNEGWFTLNAISADAWKPGEGALSARFVPKVFPARIRSLPMGILRVTFDGTGPYSVSLHGLDGSLLDARSGAGPGSADLRSPGHGVFLLKVTSGGSTFARKAAF